MVLIARALAQQGQVLLMDEPTASLDYGNQLKVLKQVKKLCREGMSVLISSHNPQHALWFADDILALDSGVMIAAGEVKTVLTPALIHQLYGVEVRLCSSEGVPLMVPDFSAPEP